jgi:3',5'-cyclic AMP phosphodiesterase CpdA
MTAFRVVQISDTHLSRHRPWFVPNFQALVRIVSVLQPDLVVNTGDISFDGSDVEDDLAFARTCHAGLDVPLRAIPGNHDVGDNPWQPDVAQPITEPRLFRYRRHFGQDHWLLETGPWVLIGLNVQLFGSGLAAEAEQWAFLVSAACRAGGRPIALFVHKPLFHEHPDEAEVNHRYVPPEHRRRLMDLLGASVRVVASGHVHQHRLRRICDVDHCWAPSTAFVLPDHRQPRLGTKHVGYVDYAFGEDRVEIRVVEPPELTNHDLDDFPDAYKH